MKNFKLAKSLIIAVLVFSVIYLLTAFVVAEINPMLWSEHSRLFVALCGPVLAFCAAGAAYDYCKE